MREKPAFSSHPVEPQLHVQRSNRGPVPKIVTLAIHLNGKLMFAKEPSQHGKRPTNPSQPSAAEAGGQGGR